MNSIAKRTSITALFAALAIILSYIEFLIPFDMAVPGAKIGLANIAMILTLYLAGIKAAYTVNIIRIIIMAVWFGNIYTFMFSLAGSMLSLTVMSVLFKLKLFNIITISACGGICHNIGQIAVAVIVMDSSLTVSGTSLSGILLAYLVPLMAAGLAAGIAIGIVSDIIVKRIGRIKL